MQVAHGLWILLRCVCVAFIKCTDLYFYAVYGVIFNPSRVWLQFPVLTMIFFIDEISLTLTDLLLHVFNIWPQPCLSHLLEKNHSCTEFLGRYCLAILVSIGIKKYIKLREGLGDTFRWMEGNDALSETNANHSTWISCVFFKVVFLNDDGLFVVARFCLFLRNDVSLFFCVERKRLPGATASKAPVFSPASQKTIQQHVKAFLAYHAIRQQSRCGQIMLIKSFVCHVGEEITWNGYTIFYSNIYSHFLGMYNVPRAFGTFDDLTPFRVFGSKHSSVSISRHRRRFVETAAAGRTDNQARE